MVQPTSPQVSASPHNSRVWRRRHQRFVLSVAVSSIIGSNQKGASWAAQVGTYSCCVPDRESVLNSDLCQDIAQNVPLKMFSGRLGGCSRIPNLGTKINCRFTKDPTTHKKKRSKEPDTHGAPTDLLSPTLVTCSKRSLFLHRALNSTLNAADRKGASSPRIPVSGTSELV